MTLIKNRRVGVRIVAEKFYVGKPRIADIILKKYEIYKMWVINTYYYSKLSKLKNCNGNMFDNKHTVTAWPSILFYLYN